MCHTGLVDAVELGPDLFVCCYQHMLYHPVVSEEINEINITCIVHTCTCAMYVQCIKWPNFGATLKICKKSNFDWNQFKLSTQHKYTCTCICIIKISPFHFWRNLA